ncbi:hypothetical protein [Vineibacter terrae]|uniref:hypothetical protein n=1 Tax=Vineibacter terrae TaxID=2586908 RepID=UPI0015B5619C|nr:hypothetical protein [Vineibacter terrae]
MKPAQNSAVLLSLIEKMKAKGSWCGETHVQKATYIMSSLFGVPNDFEFVLYKHGPYSFELSDHLSRMRVSGLLKLQPQPYPYGPSLGFGDGAGTLKEMYPKTVDRYSELVNFVSDVVAGKGVSQLEKLATALYVTDELGENKSVGERAKRLVEHKPHIDMQAANDAVSEIDGVMRLKRARFS